MKRFHVHLGVPDLNASVRFYSGLFGFEPTVRKDDYAKWMLDDPRVNFAISQRAGGRKGLNHLGLQAESSEELAGIRAQFEAADRDTTVAEPNVACCYARSNKHWVTDPQGIAWEAFHTLDTIPVYDGSTLEGAEATACCGPEIEASAAAGAAAGCCAPRAAEGGASERAACCG
jgi:catechol 2,3-dioxygenase-like lactoylglutathione lyase family enzyme